MKRVIMATGGMDSTVLLYQSVAEGVRPVVVSVNYGHAAWDKQVEMINHHIAELKLDPLVEIPVHYPEWQRKPGLFTGSGVQDDGDNPFKPELFTSQEMRYGENFVEGRNLIMVAYCLAYASSIKADELWAGYLRGAAEWENSRSYKMITGDNSPQFVDVINLAAFLGFSHQVRMRAPYYERRMDKAAVVELGELLGVDFAVTHSCYWPEPCGKCDNCLLREQVLGKA